MTAIGAVGDSVGSEVGLLDRRRIIAGPGFNRWLVPPAALAIHLCIGMAYGFSVFWLPLSKALGHDKSIECPGMPLFQALVTTSCDWRISDLGWIYTLFFVCSARRAIWGGWLERAGPRKAGVVSAFCWCGGMAFAAIGVIQHQLWIMWLGPGVIGGIGLGLGYISPVSTLIKWFPDRRGMATGMAIMGFGGGAMIGAPLANLLMNTFKDGRIRSACGRPSSPWPRSISSSWSAAPSAIDCRRRDGRHTVGPQATATRMITSHARCI